MHRIAKAGAFGKAPIAEWRAYRRRRQLSDTLRSGALAAILKTQTIFVHVPKCGGKSVIETLYGLETHDWFGHADYRFYQTLLGPSRFSSFTKFTVLRDPVERCRSAFYFARQGAFGFEAGLKRQQRLQEVDFDNFVMDGLLQDMMDSSVIFRPQWTFICDGNGRLMVDAVCRQETLEKDLRRIIGVRVVFDQVSRNNTSDYKRFEDVGTDVKIRLQEIYARDVELIKTQNHSDTPIGHV